MIENANFTLDLLDTHLALRPDKIVYHCGERVCTYRELAANVNRFAGYLEASGVAPGDRVGLAMVDSFSFVYALLGCIRRGALPVVMQTVLKRAQCEEILAHCEALFVLADPGVEAAQARWSAEGRPGRTLLLDDASIDELLAPYGPEYPAYPATADDLAFMFYTSGTTGHPKGAPHRHGSVECVMEAFPGDMLRISENDLIFSTSKIFFSYGFGNSILTTLTFGATAVLEPAPITAPLALEIIARHKPTVFYSVPTMYNAMLQAMDQDMSFDGTRCCVTAGEPMPTAVLRSWRERTGVDVFNGYGATEALFVVIAVKLNPERPITGRMLRHYEGKVVDDAGAEQPDGEPGALLIRGFSLTPYYWKDPEWSGKTMLPGGWWKSGDVFVKEGDEFTYLGRNDDMFKVGGLWVSPVQVEGALLSHPAVMACAVTSVKIGGLTQPRAHVVLRNDAMSDLETIGLLRRHVMELLPKYMCPSDIVFCDELPLTATGKIQRFKLRAVAG